MYAVARSAREGAGTATMAPSPPRLHLVHFSVDAADDFVVVVVAIARMVFTSDGE